ncbi:Putative transposase/integrase [Mycobacteroides abscessus subsp. abscessus]|uniref:tyrosine-type recombinase/integrase n=1 Tax=Mycobacteroides abscessus TaxID=36809 RepID=UPI00092CD4DC|nr:tyrosine-type recombinase/integrase [Mycobacteroides abscessus]SHT51745.1 Putative transposase/integrase [Mycobacteroides abscessus subsp. abscessus]SHT55766.1 Putative transposase/integrase [Mycobacteroides abscessus subsp. abscessus]SHT57571.1 Putative transposase/integrase [Mycobacteroides abscessus subsp. abscessus]SHX51170.1 Putative transposase/integrase [Mycobacteroides abscessus subsp. abscessus]SIB59022.1 Putative transposase/integrase [Mycobacteroides abscessus subsp. abscessus]
MTPPKRREPRPRRGGTSEPSWAHQWAQVPAQWRTPVYRIDTPPASEVFTSNKYYRPRPDGTPYDFTPAGPPRFADELAWWVYTCWREDLCRIDPGDMSWILRTLPSAVTDYQRRHGRAPESLLDLTAPELLRHAIVLFEQRNGRLPTAGYRRNLQYTIDKLYVLLAVRCTSAPWWSYDLWDLRLDPRIPQREHEPRHEQSLKLGWIEPPWLREGIRFWLRTALTHQLFTWTTAHGRSGNLGRQLGVFCTNHGYTADPLISTDPDTLRRIFLEFLDYLRSPQASAKPGGLTDYSVAGIQYEVQSFYTFMYDHAGEAAAGTDEPRWKDISPAHTRLWAPAFAPRNTKRHRELAWYSTADLQRMLAYLEVLAADRGRRVVLTHPDGAISVVAGLGDPQAARTWLLQAMTGRRASEILMLDHDPLTAIPGTDRPQETDSETFVARLRYQQTKVDGVDPTILVEQAVVDVIKEQQRWLADRYPGVGFKYLFVGMLHQHQGQRARPYSSYLNALKRLDGLHSLIDSAGNPLRFSQTHRLRHTRATELLNDGVPFHVVQRYLGHKSPEMTARYAATLAATAEAEFLKHKKIGAGGAEIAISPPDIYEMTQLGKRTDRILPNGVCLLPPLKTCDKGNACLSCGHFATDRTHLDDLRQQRTDTAALLQARRTQVAARTGRELADTNVWVAERLREIASLDAIIARLTDEQLSHQLAVAGPATANRIPLLPIATRGAHESALDHAQRQHRDPDQGRP